MNTAEQHRSHILFPPTTSKSLPNIIVVQLPHSAQHTPSSPSTHPPHTPYVATSSPPQAVHTYPSLPVKRKTTPVSKEILRLYATTINSNAPTTPPVTVPGPAHYSPEELLSLHTLPMTRSA